MYAAQDTGRREATAARLQQDEAVSKGSIARTRGDWSNSNPYLAQEMMPPRTGQAHGTWFAACDAWWRGWDTQDALIRKRRASLAETARGAYDDGHR